MKQMLNMKSEMTIRQYHDKVVMEVLRRLLLLEKGKAGTSIC